MTIPVRAIARLWVLLPAAAACACLGSCGSGSYDLDNAEGSYEATHDFMMTRVTSTEVGAAQTPSSISVSAFTLDLAKAVSTAALSGSGSATAQFTEGGANQHTFDQGTWEQEGTGVQATITGGEETLSLDLRTIGYNALTGNVTYEDAEGNRYTGITALQRVEP